MFLLNFYEELSCEQKAQLLDDINSIDLSEDIYQFVEENKSELEEITGQEINMLYIRLIVESPMVQDVNAKYIDSYGESLELIWKSLDENIATVENNGFIITHKAGVVDIRISLKDNEEIYQDIPVTILDIDTYTALEVFLEAHESNIYYEYKLPIGAGTPVYYADIIGSVSDILYNDELYIDTTYNKKTNDKYGADLEMFIILVI